MLQNRIFPGKWKTAKILMIERTGREADPDPTNYRPISLLNTESKILEKLLIKRIIHHFNRTETLNENQFGFTPPKNTVDAAMLLKKFIEHHLEKGVEITASLDV